MYDDEKIPYYSLRPNAITLYELPAQKIYSEKQREGWNNLNDNTNKYNEISEHSTRRLRKMLDYMVYITKEKVINGKKIITKHQTETTEYEKAEKYQEKVTYKLTFITLTLPSMQIHSDKEIKSKCLNHFLTVLRNKFKSELYIWKAEKQENGNIHFHILCDKYIHYTKLRECWNRIINKLGYVDAYQKKMQEYYKNGFKLSDNKNDKRSETQQRKAYEKSKAENWSNPNSTDIHSLYKVRNICTYMAKYLAKGVTKSDRISKMKNLYKRNFAIAEKIHELEKKITFIDENTKEYKTIEAETSRLEQEKEENEATLEEMKKLGVEGRIWGCSQKLSKIKNYTDIETIDNIPDIELVEKFKTYTFEIDIGSTKIHTIQFDINKTPELKTILDTHLAQTLYNKLL